MKAVKRTRYYCDHCKKSGGQANSMRAHESGCTANPNRRCGLCAWREVEQPEMAALIEAAGIGLEALQFAADNCPACMLAGIRQLRKATADNDEGGYSDSVHSTCNAWKYKDATAQFWKDHPERTTERQDAAIRSAYVAMMDAYAEMQAA